MTGPATPGDGSVGAVAPAGPSAGGAGAPAAPPSRWSRDDLLSGAIFVAFGAGFAGISATYELGALNRMGPGYFPMALGIILAAFGFAIIITSVLVSLRGKPVAVAEDRGGIPWMRGALVLGAIMLFGFLVAPVGLVPALLVATFLSALAGHGTSVKGAAVISVGLTLMCVVIFVLILQLKLPLFVGMGG